MPQSTRFLLCGAAVAAALSGCTTLGPDFKAWLRSYVTEEM